MSPSTSHRHDGAEEVQDVRGGCVAKNHCGKRFPRPEPFICKAFDDVNAASCFLFDVIRASVITNELSIVQVVLTHGLAELLDKLGPTVFIEGALNVSHSNAKAIPPTRLLTGFAQVKAMNLKSTSFGQGMPGDDFLLKCVEV